METKRLKLIFAGLICCTILNSQNFTWKKGSNTINQGGAYGTLGVPAATATPGAREGAVSWRDLNNNLWLFGGIGYDFVGNNGILNDLWKYDPNTNQWTWMHGDQIISQLGDYGVLNVPAASNKPGSRQYAVSWTDQSGNLWLYGGNGHNNSPGIGLLQDLWKFTISTNEWTWMGGSTNLNMTATYGSQNVPAASNMPGSRHSASAWRDNNGNLWLFGGVGYDAATTTGHLSDLWRYNISSGQWTWVKGSSSIDQAGVYGTLGTAASTNRPGGRRNSHAWVDASGNAWLFGGSGFDSFTPIATILSDMWHYNIATNEWTWVKGSNTAFQTGNYNVQGVPTASTIPGSRFGGITWIDVASNMWLMGGRGLPGSGNAVGQLNDLWKYDRVKNEWTWITNASISDQTGFYGTLNVPAFTNRPGARSGAVSWIDNANNLWLFGGAGFPASGASGHLNDLWKYNNCYISPVTMTIVSKDSSICAGESTSLTASGATTYLWAHNSFTTPNVVISPNQTITYTVNTTDANNCIYSAFFTQTVNTCAGITNQNSEISISLNPNPSRHFVVIKIRDGQGNVQIVNGLGAIVLSKSLNEDETVLEHHLPAGIYYCIIETSSGTKATKRLVVVN